MSRQRRNADALTQLEMQAKEIYRSIISRRAERERQGLPAEPTATRRLLRRIPQDLCEEAKEILEEYEFIEIYFSDPRKAKILLCALYEAPTGSPVEDEAEESAA